MIVDSATINTRFPTTHLLVSMMFSLSLGPKSDTQLVVILEKIQPTFHLFIRTLLNDKIRTLAKHQTIIRNNFVANKSLRRYFDVITQMGISDNHTSCMQADVFTNGWVTAFIPSDHYVLPQEQSIGVFCSSQNGSYRMLHEEDVWKLDLIEDVESMQGFVEGIHAISRFSVSRLKSYPRQIAKQDRILTRMMYINRTFFEILIGIPAKTI